MNIHKLSLSLLLLACIAASGAQESPDSVTSKAKALYEQGSYVDAYALLVKAAPDSADAKTKTAAADCLVEIGQSEYSAKNFKNAYESFRTALKMRPTNQTATQMYLKMKKEMDVANLANAAPITPKASVALAAPPRGGAAAPAPELSGDPSQPSKEEMQRLMARLQAAQSQLSASSRSSGKIDAQVAQRVLDLLSDIVRNLAERPAPQVVIQEDPKLVALLDGLGLMLDRSNRVALDPKIVVAAIAVAFLLLAFSFTILISLIRANRRLLKRESPNRDATTRIAPPRPSDSFIVGGGRTQLLEYSGSEAQPRMPIEGEAALRKGLLIADRLQAMRDEFRSGTLRWATVAANIDMLESSLKAEILDLVEEKLDTGDLVSYDAVLPIVFPFLTDYEDFFRDKADNLARASLISSEGAEANAGPFELRELMRIPERLKETLNGADRSLVTAKLARAVAKKLGLSAADRENVYKGALAHDVGYLALDPNRILRIIGKREISPEDRAYIKSHASRGPAAFGDVTLPDYLSDAILFHHERMDGSGYPKGLAGEEIPLIARIIGVSETFVSLISKRSYRDRFETSQAVAILEDGKGAKFDPAIVDAVVAIGARLEASL